MRRFAVGTNTTTKAHTFPRNFSTIIRDHVFFVKSSSLAKFSIMASTSSSVSPRSGTDTPACNPGLAVSIFAFQCDCEMNETLLLVNRKRYGCTQRPKSSVGYSLYQTLSCPFATLKPTGVSVTAHDI